MRKREGETATTEDGIEVFAALWVASADAVHGSHLTAVARTEIKEGTRFCGKSPKICVQPFVFTRIKKSDRNRSLQVDLKPVLNWANVCSPEHTSDTSTNYDSFLN